VEQNRVKWNRMERDEISLSFYCLDILEMRGIKLKVSGGMRRNLFHHISFHSIPLLFVKSKQ
jgi:hypothetical protein